MDRPLRMRRCDRSRRCDEHRACDPRRVIPRAIIATLFLTMVLYISVALVGVGAVGTDVLAGTAQTQAAPLEIAAQQFGNPLVSQIVAVGAITAMLGVLLNLILGLSRVLLAMGHEWLPLPAWVESMGALAGDLMPKVGR